RVVDRIGRARGERIAVEAQEIQVAGGIRDGFLRGGEDFRPQPLELGEKRAGGECEHAAVPEIAALGEERLRALRVGLLDEAADAESTVVRRDRLARL